jgi:DNA polymerase-3 subunit alpha
MKANFPVEYYAALLSANMDDKDKLAAYIEDCRRLEIRVLPPDANHSAADFEVEEGAIRFGLGAVKGCGRAAIEAMVAARASGGEFADLFDFCFRVQDGALLNKATVESLIKVGAFASIEPNRARLLEMLPDAVNAAAARLRDRKTGQTGLFGGDADDLSYRPNLARYDHVAEFPLDQILAVEKDLVGIYLSGHPLESVRATIERKCTANGQTFRDLENDRQCVVGGIITDIRYRQTRRNERMASIRLEDLHGTIPVTFFPAAFKTCAQQIEKDRIVIIKGKASHRERIAADEENATVEVEILGESVTLVKGTNGVPNGNGSRSVHIRINGDACPSLEMLKQLIEAYPGESPVYFHVLHSGGRQRIATPHKVDPSPKFVSEIERVLGRDVVRVT